MAPITAVGVFIAQFNPNAYTPQIQAAVYKVTGRNLHFGDPLRLQLSLTPTLVATNITLSNPAGFTNPALLTLTQVQAQVALLPLLHHRLDILDLKLVQPTLYLERNSAGQADWILHPTQTPPTSAGPSAAPKENTTNSHLVYSVAVESVSLENGRVILPSTGAGQTRIIQLTSLTGKASGLDAPLHITGSATISTAPLILQGLVGPVSVLTGDAPHPWPIDLTFRFAGAVARLQGHFTNPQQLRGYDLHFTAQVPALEQVSATLPTAWLHGQTLPALHDVMVSLTLNKQPTGQPKLSDITIQAGASDLSGLWPGLHLTALDASVATMNAPGTVRIKGDIRQTPLMINAQWTGMGYLFPASSPFAGQGTGDLSGKLNVSLGQATASLKGEIATPQSLSGAALALGANIPDLSALSAAWGSALPAFKDINLNTILTDSGGQGLTQAINLDSLTVSMQNARFGGNANLTLGIRPDVKLNLAIESANLDALRALIPNTTLQPGNSPAAAKQPVQTHQTPVLNFSPLRRIDADITLSADHLIYGHTDYSALQAHVLLKNGLLTIAPFTGQSPSGAFFASGSLDANVAPAAETLKLNAPALALGPLLQMFSLPSLAQGTAQLQMNVTAHGNTPAAILGSVSGQFGLASVNDEIDGALVTHILGKALQTAGLPAAAIKTAGPVFVRCLALRLDAKDGSGQFKALTFDSSRLLLLGGGTVNFASQTLGLILKPQMRVGSSDISVPISVNGAFASPRYGIASKDALSTAGQDILNLTSQPGQKLFGTNAIIGKLIGDLTGQHDRDVCASALPLARMGQTGPAPRTMATPTIPAPSLTPRSPRNLLKALLNP